jgi:hypothetical protein
MEIVNVRNNLRLQAQPALHAGRYGFAMRAPVMMLVRRLRMRGLILPTAGARLVGTVPPMQEIQRGPPALEDPRWRSALIDRTAVTAIRST